MKKDIFSSMKDQMTPDTCVEAALRYELEKRKHRPLYSAVIRWGSVAVAAFTSAILVFNLAMPAYAEKLPIIGDALVGLNELGNDSREKGITPEFLIKEPEVKKDYSLSVTKGECDGLDIKMKIEIKDLRGSIAAEAEYITLSDAIFEMEGAYLYPTDESPRLSRNEDGGFSGWATFNSSTIATRLESGEDYKGILYCDRLCAFVEGATFGDSVSKYTYDFREAAEVSVAVDKSSLSVEYLGIEKYGINLEHRLSTDERTDITFTVSEEVEYPSSFSVYTDMGSPILIAFSRAAEGGYVYVATFNTEDETVEGYLNDIIDEEESIYVGNSDIILYSEATGEYYPFESEVEVG